MPERPLLILPVPGQLRRPGKFGGGAKFHQPSRRRQGERLAPRFATLQNALARPIADSAGTLPEEVVVLETVGQVDDFIGAVQRVVGMEWLGEIEEEAIPPDDDFFALDTKGRRRRDKELRGRLFLVFSNQEALRQLLSLWGRWQSGQPLAHGLKKWADVFAQLHDVRQWGVRDRLLDTGVLDDWRERVAHNQEVVPCEIELWFRRDPQTRDRARGRVAGLVTAMRGEVLNQAVVEDIAYHAALVRLPIAAVQQILSTTGQETALVQCEQIQFFRATGQMTGFVSEGERIPDTAAVRAPRGPAGLPVVAVFDGMPLQNHRRLVGRLIVDDPDNLEASYQAQERRHGTAMASLLVHGDLDAHQNALSRSTYVRPILQPDARDWRTPRRETVAENALVVDLLHRAVRRLFEGEGTTPPVAPSVCVANLSIGIQDRPFQFALSPLARLIDWLAWRYKLLFLVSAGNHTDSIDLGIPRAAFAALDAADVQNQVLRAVAANARHRRLLSPAEAVNALTIGSVHEDASDVNAVPRSIDPFVDRGLPSPINGQGMGYRRAIKPDLLLQGGRVVLQERLRRNANAALDVYVGTLRPGHRVAAPGTIPGDTSASWYSRGTSNATALTSRAAAILYDVLQDLRNEPGGGIIDAIPYAVWLKAMLAHSADWGAAESTLERALKSPDNSGQFREYLTRLLGYGALQPSHVAECTAHRVTALGGGHLTIDQAHVHRLPLPPSLSARRGRRRLTITLAWFTPINPSHQAWRRADLWFSPINDPLRVDRQQADGRAARRGTLQHEVFEGQRAAAYLDGESCEIQVNCRAEAGALEEAVPYALAMTLEIGDEIGIPIYDEVRARVHAARITVTPTE